MTNTEKGTDGVNEQDVFNIKQRYFGLKHPIGRIADDLKLRISQIIRAVHLNETNPVEFTEDDFSTCRWILRKG